MELGTTANGDMTLGKSREEFRIKLLRRSQMELWSKKGPGREVCWVKLEETSQEDQGKF